MKSGEAATGKWKTASSKRETKYLTLAINEEFSSHYIIKRKLPSDLRKELKILELGPGYLK